MNAANRSPSWLRRAWWECYTLHCRKSVMYLIDGRTAPAMRHAYLAAVAVVRWERASGIGPAKVSEYDAMVARRRWMAVQELTRGDVL